MAEEDKALRDPTNFDESQMDIVKVEPGTQCYVEEESNLEENGVMVSATTTATSFDNNSIMVQRTDLGTLNLWTSKATTCLISQYKKYRSMVGQSTQIRSLREMFEMISLEMRNYGFHFSPQKCENKWRVLERKYKNLVFRERLKKPGRMRHYGHWEHKRALDEIFNEKKRRTYLEENDFASSQCGTSTEHVTMASKSTTNNHHREHEERNNVSGSNYNTDRRQIDPLTTTTTSSLTQQSKRNDDRESSFDSKTTSLVNLFETFLEDMRNNFTLAERNKERRHKEKMAMRQSKLEVQRRLLKIEEEKIELKKRQVIAAAQHLHANMK